MLAALLVLALLFGLLLVGRLGTARRRLVVARWPAFVLAGAALLVLARGSWPMGILLALLAGVAWELWPRLAAGRGAPQQKPSDPAEQEARAILGVPANASASEIRAAYRKKMAEAHPDRGGSHAEAARLTAARDRLLKRRW